MKLDPNPGENPVEAWSKQFSRDRKTAKPPKTNWFDVARLPSLHGVGGEPVAAGVVLRLIGIQSKHKSIEAAPDIIPLLGCLDRPCCEPFALALLEGFLGFEQAAGDRWAMTLAGLLGDSRIIPPLLARIPGWCDNARHKLAEYAARTIALLPGNEPLMVLDTLANRYRDKFRNVGKACAAARGVTPGKLGDLVVPAFGFDDGVSRVFIWGGGSVTAVLENGFKLTWTGAAGDRTWRNPPGFVPGEVRGRLFC